MKILKIDNKEYVFKFATMPLRDLNRRGITLVTLSEEVEKMNLDGLYTAFHYGMKFHKKDITEVEAFELIDKYLEDGNTLEGLIEVVLTEYSNALGMDEEVNKGLKKAKSKEKAKK